MVSAFTFLVVYIVGGLTFIPLCLCAFLALLFYSSPKVDPDVSLRKTGLPDLAASAEDLEPVDVYRAGWLTVRRTYEPTADSNGGTYVGMLASGYRSFLDNRSKDPRRSKPKDVFYAVLKNHFLFLYESEEQAECWAAIEVSAHDVVIFPEGNVDGELFVKRTAIELKPRKVVEDEPGTPTGQPVAEGAAYDPQTGKPLPWFLFAKVNSDKEDWYHSLTLASRLNSSSSATSLAADRALFSPEDMARLVESIDAQPDSIPMRWFNAFLGRVFLTAYRTSSLEDYLVSRLVRKLKRVKLPSLLSEVQVREVNVGSSVPLFSRPMLKELTSEGDASMEVHVSYIGAVRITISTVATFTLASRTYSVRLVLAVVLRELEGTLLVKMKTPPSNRIWFGFTKEPKMRIDVEPVVSARQIKWSLVTGPIESRIRELIIESLVLPHMDDLSFFDTRSQPLSRGGVYGPFLRKEREVDTPTSSNSNAKGAKGEDVSEKPTGGDEEDLLDAGKEEREGTTPSVSTGGDDLRQRSTGMRRRRSSSEGGSSTLAGGDLSRTGTTSSTATGGGKSSSVKTSSSVSSGLAAMSASIANWRENRAATAAAANNSAASSPGLGPAEGAGTEGGGAAGGKRKTSWFTKSSSSSSASTPSASTPLAAPGARNPSAERGRAEEKKDDPPPPPLPTPKELKEKDEEALKRLNAVLGGGGKRAESKEREEVKPAAEEEVVESKLMSRPPLIQTKSNLSLTAPTLTKDDKPLPLNEPASTARPSASAPSIPSAPLDVDTSPDHPPALPPRQLTDSPVPLNAPVLSSAASTKSTRSTLFSNASTHETDDTTESATPTAATTATDASTTAPPALPSRDRSPSLIKTLPVTPPSSTLDLSSTTSSSPAPSTTPSSSVPPPPPPRRGHSPSPSLPHNTPSRPLSIPHAPASPSSPRQRVPSSSSSHQNPPGSPTFHSSTSTTSSSPAGLLASWRSGNTNLRSVEGREEAKEALAQGVAQGVKEAKEKWGKWSAGWGKKNASSTSAEDSSSSSAPTATAPVAIPRPRTPDRPARPTRQNRSSSLSLSSSPSGGRGGAAFSPAPGSPATAAVSAVSASPSSASHTHVHSSGSPSKPSMGYSGGYGTAGGGGGGVYKRASMMTLPGLAAQGVDRGKRERVKEDHLGTGVGVAPPASAADSTKETAAAPAPTAEVAGAADVSSSSSWSVTAPQPSTPASSAPKSEIGAPAASETNEARDPPKPPSPPTLPPRLPSATVPAPSPGIAAEEALAPPLAVVEQSDAKGEKEEKKAEEAA